MDMTEKLGKNLTKIDEIMQKKHWKIDENLSKL